MSLTPAERNAEATSAAMWEGGVNGLMTLVPSTTAVYLAMKNSPTFFARTNMQSRTALAIMPALFMFAWTAVSATDRAPCARTGVRQNQTRRGSAMTNAKLHFLRSTTRYTGRKIDAQDERDRQGIRTCARYGPLGGEPPPGLP
eukprot:scaffold618_cov175-Amphora_coffeaeformis.AAC.12